ncbi:MAG: ATP-binding protein [Methanomicrobiales archaeon]|nr:ATP-binding protein [Methanomicrobiales archaeon]
MPKEPAGSEVDAGKRPLSGPVVVPFLKKYALQALFIVGIIVMLFEVSTFNYLLFHSTVEIVTIAISVAIFLLVWKSRRILDNNYLLFIGMVFLFIAIIDFFHTLTYRGMGVFPGVDTNLATQLWLAARYLQAGALLVAPVFASRRFRPDLAIGAFGILAGLALASIFVWGVFPVAYVEGSGLTPFKIMSEYVICGMLILSIGFLYQRREHVEPQVLDLLDVAILLTVAGELAFTSYVGVNGFANFAGHIFRLFAGYFFYKAIIEVGQEKPYSLLFRNLNESEKKYHALIDLSPDAIIVHSRGRVRYANPAALRFFRVPWAGDLAGENIFDYVHPDDRAIAMARVDAVHDRQVTNPLRELRFVVNGETIPIEATSGPVNWEGEPAVQAVIRDISERKMAEAVIRQSEEKYRTLFETMTEGFALHEIVCDDQAKPMDYRFLEVNSVFESLTGLAKGDIIGHLASEVMPGLEPSWIQTCGTVATSGKPVRFETPLTLLERQYEVLAYSPAPRQFALLFTDITEKKKAEEELAQTVTELRRSNQDLEQFAYVASHDLQEPLRNVTLFSQLFMKKYGETLTKEGREYLDFVIEGSSRMSRLIYDLLDYSRVTTRGEPFVPVDMNDAVRDACTNLQMKIQESGASVTFDTLPVVLADALQIRQVFQNLIDNALKYHSTEPPAVRITAVRDENEWIFSLRDNGIGIAPEYHERIFQLFKRLHTREKYSGTGIGLSLVKKIIDRHGGRIWVESEEGKGSTFSFTLPVRALTGTTT